MTAPDVVLWCDVEQGPSWPDDDGRCRDCGSRRHPTLAAAQHAERAWIDGPVTRPCADCGGPVDHAPMCAADCPAICPACVLRTMDRVRADRWLP